MFIYVLRQWATAVIETHTHRGTLHQLQPIAKGRDLEILYPNGLPYVEIVP